eukprot:COSAG05_NODE_3810_length_1828_cov_0.918450_3_plen_72_part_00
MEEGLRYCGMAAAGGSSRSISIARACDLGAPLKVDMRERRSCLRKASHRQIGKLITSPEIQPSELAHMAYA